MTKTFGFQQQEVLLLVWAILSRNGVFVMKGACRNHAIRLALRMQRQVHSEFWLPAPAQTKYTLNKERTKDVPTLKCNLM